VVTPSGDPLTLLLLSGPLYVLYELTIWLVRFILRR
jgi:Sec-independent protein secretion pathway component TatC